MDKELAASFLVWPVVRHHANDLRVVLRDVVTLEVEEATAATASASALRKGSSPSVMQHGLGLCSSWFSIMRRDGWMAGFDKY